MNENEEKKVLNLTKQEWANVCASIFANGIFWFIYIAFWILLSFKVFIIDHVEKGIEANETPYLVTIITTFIIFISLAFWGAKNRKANK